MAGYYEGNRFSLETSLCIGKTRDLGLLNWKIYDFSDKLNLVLEIQ
jgi:hypothetical protein